MRWTNSERARRVAARRARHEPAAILASMVALACLAGLPAREAVASAPAESVVFVREAALWRVSPGGGEPVALAALGDDAAAVTRLAGSPRGDAVLVELGERVAWVPVERGREASALRPLDCAPPARFSPDGRHLACAGPGSLLAIYELPAGKRRKIDVPAASVLGFVDGGTLALADQVGLWAVPVASPGARALLAPHRPSGALMIGPRGQRAAGVYPALPGHPSPGMYVFRLDGKGVRRRLLAGTTPLAWSRDGRWLAAQSERLGACLVRAAGGEYKCWKRHLALGLAPDGSHLLLSKRSGEGGAESARFDLYRGERDGVRPAPPKLVARDIAGPATWLPACADHCR